MKLHGALNDFIFFPACEFAGVFSNIPALQKFALTVCSRRAHLGADGIVFWSASVQENSFKMLILNSDGSFASTCGNALRCLGLLLVKNGHWQGKEKLNIESMNALEFCRSETTSLEPNYTYVTGNFATLLPTSTTLNSGKDKSELLKSHITVSMGKVHTVHKNPLKKEKIQAIITKILGFCSDLESVFVQLGNPHCVVFCPDFARFNAHQQELFGIAFQELMQNDPEAAAFPCANIGLLYQKMGWFLTVYERGAGLTPCCGSGACAAWSSLVEMGMILRLGKDVPFDMPGGRVLVGEVEEELCLTGPAQWVAQGDFSFCPD